MPAELSTLRGHATVNGAVRPPVVLVDADEVAAFIEAHLFDDEVVITDPLDQLIFRALEGVDVFSRLDEIGIDLPALYRRVRAAAVDEAGASSGDREPWEDLYDSIGLSPGEVAMRQRVKQLTKAARTVADVVELLADTYFDAWFESEDGTRSWRFDPAALTMTAQSDEEPIPLLLDQRVRHSGSGEDLHSFVLIGW